jgi:hypothetical protein
LRRGGGEGVSVNIIEGPVSSSVATRVMGTGLEENLGMEAWREREGRSERIEDARLSVPAILFMGFNSAPWLLPSRIDGALLPLGPLGPVCTVKANLVSDAVAMLPLASIFASLGGAKISRRGSDFEPELLGRISSDFFLA